MPTILIAFAFHHSVCGGSEWSAYPSEPAPPCRPHHHHYHHHGRTSSPQHPQLCHHHTVYSTVRYVSSLSIQGLDPPSLPTSLQVCHQQLDIAGHRYHLECPLSNELSFRCDMHLTNYLPYLTIISTSGEKSFCFV